jgi:hypothetical protein
MAPPILNDYSGFDLVGEPFQTQALVTQFAIEAFTSGGNVGLHAHHKNGMRPLRLHAPPTHLH